MESLGNSILVGVISFILGLFGNYFVNWTSAPIAQKFRKWRDDRAQIKAMKSVKNASKRIESLELDLKILSLYIKYPVILNAITFKRYALMALNFAAALFAGFSYFAYGANPISNKFITIQVITALWVPLNLFVVALLVFQMVALMDKIAFFSTYEEKISKQIADLLEVIKKFEDAEITSNPKT